MFLRPVVPFVVALTCVSVTACVTNMASVATFGAATSTVSQETSVALTRMSQGCTDLLILISSQRTLGTSVLSRGDPTPYKSTSSRAQYSDAQWKTLANYVKSLQGQEGELSSECAQMARFAPIMQGVGASLAAYASAIKALAQNEFVTYKPVPHFQLEAISAIPTDGPDPLLTQPQVAAIGVLQMLLHKAATESYQQDKLKEVLSESNEEVVIRVVNALQRVSTRYAVTLNCLRRHAQTAADESEGLQMTGGQLEPITQPEFSLRMRAQEATAEAKLGALEEYVALLDELRPTFEKARASVDHVPAQDLDVELNDFAQAAYKVQQKMQLAF